jgi:heme oxygenase
MISERLRNETAEHHEAIENARRFSRLGSDDFSKQEYVQILEKFYGFYKPLEEAFRQHPDVMQALDYERRFKLPLLRADLLHFGHTDDTLAQLEQCDALPPTQTLPQVLGAIYVMEGSTHGSQFIAKRLREQLNLDGQGLTFYEGYGKDTMPQWKAFKAYLDDTLSARPAQDGDAVVNAAGAIFNALHRWMD